jgi:hypothetical protein
MQSREHFLIHSGDATRGVAESRPIRIFADGFEDLGNRPLNPIQINRSVYVIDDFVHVFLVTTHEGFLLVWE